MRDLDDFRVTRTKRLLRECGEDVFISPKAVIWPESGLRVGKKVQIHSFTHIFAGGGVTIGDYTMVSAGCSIASVTHPVEHGCRREAAQIEKPVVIGKNVWLGTGAIILPGISIGDNAVIGAGAIVTHDVLASNVVAGNPARVLRTLSVPTDLQP